MRHAYKEEARTIDARASSAFHGERGDGQGAITTLVITIRFRLIKPAQGQSDNTYDTGCKTLRPKQWPQSLERHPRRGAAQTTTGRVRMGRVGGSYELMTVAKRKFHVRNTRSCRGLN